MRKLLNVCIVLTYLTPCCMAQNRIQLAYNGASVLHPGLHVDFSRVLVSRTTSLGENRQKSHQLLAGLQAGSYYHHHMHTGIYLTPHLEWVKSTRRKFQYGLGLSAGYLRTFIPEVYKIEASGNVVKKKFTGAGHFVVTPSLRLGGRLGRNGFIDEWYVKNKLMRFSPYPGGSTYRYFLEIGFTHLLK